MRKLILGACIILLQVLNSRAQTKPGLDIHFTGFYPNQIDCFGRFKQVERPPSDFFIADSNGNTVYLNFGTDFNHSLKQLYGVGVGWLFFISNSSRIGFQVGLDKAVEDGEGVFYQEFFSGTWEEYQKYNLQMFSKSFRRSGYMPKLSFDYIKTFGKFQAGIGAEYLIWNVIQPKVEQNLGRFIGNPDFFWGEYYETFPLNNDSAYVYDGQVFHPKYTAINSSKTLTSFFIRPTLGYEITKNIRLSLSTQILIQSNRNSYLANLFRAADYWNLYNPADTPRATEAEFTYRRPFILSFDLIVHLNKRGELKDRQKFFEPVTKQRGRDGKSMPREI